jgi:hypothetical protein
MMPFVLFGIKFQDLYEYPIVKGEEWKLGYLEIVRAQKVATEFKS